MYIYVYICIYIYVYICIYIYSYVYILTYVRLIIRSGDLGICAGDEIAFKGPYAPAGLKLLNRSLVSTSVTGQCVAVCCSVLQCVAV